MITDETMENTPKAKIVRLQLAKKEDQVLAEIHLPAKQTCTTVRLLDLEGVDSTKSLSIVPAKVPASVVITNIQLTDCEEVPQTGLQEQSKKLDQQLEVNMIAGNFFVQAIEKCEKSIQDAEDLSKLTDLIESRLSLLVQKNALIRQEQERIQSASTKRNAVYAKIIHNGMGGKIQFLVKYTKVSQSDFHYEYRYQSKSRTGCLNQYFEYACPFAEPVTADVVIYNCDRVPELSFPKVQKAQVCVSVEGQIQLKNLKLGDAKTRLSDPVCELSNMELTPGTNILNVREFKSSEQNVRFEAVPEEVPGNVYAVSQLCNESDQTLVLWGMRVFRDDLFIQKHCCLMLQPGEKIDIQCGVEPDMSVELSTVTKRHTKSEKDGAQVSMLDVEHTIAVTAPSADFVRVKLQLPEVDADSPCPVKVIPLRGSPEPETYEAFDDPGSKESTIHVVNDSVVVLRVATNGGPMTCKESFSYRIKWQNNVLPKTGGFLFPIMKQTNARKPVSGGFSFPTSTDSKLKSKGPTPFGKPVSSKFPAPPAPTQGLLPIFGAKQKPAPSAPLDASVPFGAGAPQGPFGGTNVFGAAAQTSGGVFGAQALAAPTTSPFGGFVAPRSFFGSSCVRPYEPTSCVDGSVNIAVQSITAMDEYKGTSFEELRMKHNECAKMSPGTFRFDSEYVSVPAFPCRPSRFDLPVASEDSGTQN